jgi:hypothetical protein
VNWGTWSAGTEDVGVRGSNSGEKMAPGKFKIVWRLSFRYKFVPRHYFIPEGAS